MRRDNHQDIVAREHAKHPPEKTVEGALAFVVRVVAALPREERAGLLRKPAGENIAPFHDVMVSAGRICYSDGQLYKIITDVPATMDPVWNDDGTVEPSRYFDISPFLETDTSGDGNGDGNSDGNGDETDGKGELADELTQLLDLGERVIVGLSKVEAAIVALNTKVADVQNTGVKIHLRP